MSAFPCNGRRAFRFLERLIKPVAKFCIVFIRKSGKVKQKEIRFLSNLSQFGESSSFNRKRDFSAFGFENVAIVSKREGVLDVDTYNEAPTFSYDAR